MSHEHPTPSDAATVPPQPSPAPSVALHELETVTGRHPSPLSPEGRGVRGDALVVPPELVDHPRYRVVRLLGQGGMGAVYLAEHRVMERLVALKVMRAELVRDDAAVDRFRREVRTAARLWHPNIVTAFDADQVGALHFLVMEYVEGVDLAKRLALNGPLPVAEACSHLRHAALGLHHAFEKGMIHRDIKPHNLILATGEAGERFGRVKILDFGLARFSNAASSGQTASGMILGTVDFMAPEQADNARTVDIRADIYSLGCSLYYLLAARVPFPEGSLLQKMLAQMEKAPEPLSQFRTDLPPLLLNVITRMMAKKPEERYQTPAEVAQVLEPFLDENRTIVSAVPFAAEVVEPPPRTKASTTPTVLELADTETLPAKAQKPQSSPRNTRMFSGACLLGCAAFVVVSLALVGGLSYLGYNAIMSAVHGIATGFEDEPTAWQRLDREWKGPPIPATDDQLFPTKFGDYTRSYVDNNTTVEAIDLTRGGKHAHYKGWARDVDVNAYGPVPESEKEALYQRIIDLLAKKDHFGESFSEEQERLRNSPKAAKLLYRMDGLNVAMGARHRGSLWWKDNWLFLLRSDSFDDPEAILRKFLDAKR
jgi:serine/threonine protein kinase